MGNVRITTEEVAFLKDQCPFFPPEYLVYLENFRYDPSCLDVRFIECTHEAEEADSEILGEMAITARGKWCDTTLFEGRIIQFLVEIYWRDRKGWSPDQQYEMAYQNAIRCTGAGCRLADFGSRRRRSLACHDHVLRGMQDAFASSGEPGGEFLGTSNVHLSRTLGTKPRSTLSHEWFMGIGAIVGDYKRASGIAMTYWFALYGEWFDSEVSQP